MNNLFLTMFIVYILYSFITGIVIYFIKNEKLRYKIKYINKILLKTTIIILLLTIFRIDFRYKPIEYLKDGFYIHTYIDKSNNDILGKTSKCIVDNYFFTEEIFIKKYINKYGKTVVHEDIGTFVYIYKNYVVTESLHEKYKLKFYKNNKEVSTEEILVDILNGVI